MNELSYVELKGITKSFGTVVANSNINFSLNWGEIYALLGENGLGKSTLINILLEIYSPANGNLFINGEEVRFDSPNDAIIKGIGMIHQYFKLVEA